MKRNDKPDMPAEVVIDLLKLFEQHQIKVTLDGGWGVAALLREQTRAHADLDIVIAYLDADRIRTVLKARNYGEISQTTTKTYNFMMVDDQGYRVDIHTYSFDPVNHPEYGIDYPLESLNGRGTIDGYPVWCISIKYMVSFHTGYELDETDYHDTKALCHRFGIELPQDYNDFERMDPSHHKSTVTGKPSGSL
jgi:lincosamide nucleotidyltransferase A/C/D/E